MWKKRTIRYREGIELRLVIAEKRSVAFAIAQALGGVRQGDGYVSAGGALISWAQGHLVELSDPEEYSDMPWSAHKWTMDSLPIDPKSWRWRLSGAKGAAQRYRSLVELLRSDKVTELVNACDPDREGEAIFRRILMAAKVSKPSLRLWVASLDEQAIRDAWNRMRPASDYDGLAVAADARAKADWLVGMNASRAHTLAWHRSLSLGRVRTPTLNMVVQRDLAIESHKPTPFWRLIVPMDGWTLESGKIEDQVMARRILADAMGLPAEILEVRRRREHAKPPTLFDLTGLQKAMSERHGLTAEQTLDCLQHLYEMKVATYPRTDSKYITHDDVDGLKELLQPKYALGFLDQKPVETVFLNEIRTACAAMPGRVMEMTRRDNLQQLVRQAGERESFGPCPRCGKPVVKTGSVWQCSSNKSVKDDAGAWKLSEGCGYKIFAEKFGKKLTDSMVRRTLEGKRPKVSDLKSKAGKTFDARLVPDRQYGIGLSFDDLNRKKK